MGQVHVKKQFDEEEMPVKFRKLVALWGSDDSHFEIPEIEMILGVNRNEIKTMLAELKRDYPKAYKYYARRRQQFRKQSRFEDKQRRFSGDTMDEEYSWEENADYLELPPTAQVNYKIKQKIGKNKDNFSHNENEDVDRT